MNFTENFKWDQSHQDIFDAAKLEIVEQVKFSVNIYVTGKPTALLSDCSKSGIGYTLMQKHCRCLTCCNTGWGKNFILSKFLTEPEMNYAAVERKLLGVTWALEKTRLWNLEDFLLMVFSDHKPYLRIIGNK